MDTARDAYHPRAGEGALDRLLGTFPVVVVTGARQTGKSTLVAEHTALRGRTTLTLDDPATRAAAERDPAAFVARDRLLIIDEVQRVPDLLLAIKAEVDRERQRTKGRFVVTGSANLLMMKQVSDSLAGRAGYLEIGPLTRRELLGVGETGAWSVLFDHDFDEWRKTLSRAQPAGNAPNWKAAVRRGGMPVPALQLTAAQRPDWFRAYVTTYLERDLRTLSVVGLLGDFQQTMEALALRVGGPVNQTDIARDLGIQQRNISRWMDLLETSWMLARIPAFARNRGVRLAKRPKIYWNDVALALHLAGEPEPSGAHLENLVAADLLAWVALQAARTSLLYWRTADNAEVDFVIERGQALVAVEVKATARPGPNDWRHLERFVAEHKGCRGALLLHTGSETIRVADRILATPLWNVI